VDTAQVVDTFLGHWSPSGSGAINFLWNQGSLNVQWVQWDYSLCSQEMVITGECVPFLEEDGIIFTAGYAAVLLIFVPMALMDLKVRRELIQLTRACCSAFKLNSFLHTLLS
jgi:hypothetical protein